MWNANEAGFKPLWISAADKCLLWVMFPAKTRQSETTGKTAHLPNAIISTLATCDAQRKEKNRRGG